MSWSSGLLLALSVALSGCSAHQSAGESVCPVRADQPLRFADVFDGPISEMATLLPDKGDEHSGYWSLGYVYDAGRFVVVRCKYADKKTEEVKLTKKIERCDYTLDSSQTLKIVCK